MFKRLASLRLLAVLAAILLTMAACGSDDDTTDTSGDTGSDSSDSGDSGGDTVAVSLITKDSTNAFFVAMQEGAKDKAAELGVDLTVGSGQAEGDDQGQIDLIENAIAAGQDGILITPMSVNVNNAIQQARDAGLYVIALDTPTDPPDVVDITFATDNCLAGEAIGQWAAGKLDGEKAVIARLIIFDDRTVSVDYCRDNGFLRGMGIDIGDLTVIGDEPESGNYATGAGGEYEIACVEATGANEEGGRTGMETCLAKNPDINVVYTINEPTAFGAIAALEAAGKTVGDDVFVVSVDGGLAGVQRVQDGGIQATSQQYPLRMASLGLEAIKEIAEGGAPPENTSADGTFFDTGVALCTDDPMDAVTVASQETSQYCIDNAWG
ncbi:MAG: substrate-binding domain-containing protein [Acidimicrobiales bacterium]|nr:substrate-binding domain-containing protein [Acidimicrobiales bacterium]RZV45189.1 MAG: sugar ABC transporter substrate-binding protein [Acidimicrobiia bacterium]